VKLRPGDRTIAVTKDLPTGRVTVERFQDDGLTRIVEIDWAYGSSARRLYSIHPDDPLSAETRIRWTKDYARDGFSVHIDARTRMRVSREHFLITAMLDAYEGETRVFSKEWDCRIPRDHV
jgi:uncharacterized protein